MAVSTSGTEISSINKKDFPKKGNKILKIIDILHEFYGDFDFIKEKWNEDYEGLLIKTKEEQKYKRCRLAKRTPKKEGYFTVFWKKDQNNNNILILMKTWVMNLLLSQSTATIVGYLLFRKRWQLIRGFSLQGIVKGKWQCVFIHLGVQI